MQTNATHPGAPGIRILVIDADPASRSMYRETFERAGWEVIEATDGRDGLVKALVGNPSCVITELGLPLIDGVSLCEILRRDRTTTDIPIMVVTSDTRRQLFDRARDAGVDDVLAKSGAINDLVLHVQTVMSQPRFDSTASRPSSPRVQSRSRMLTKTFERFATKTPSTPPPPLSCPQCGQRLSYEESQIGGVSSRSPERWDYFNCSTCGRFQYRHRTRKIRLV